MGIENIEHWNFEYKEDLRIRDLTPSSMFCLHPNPHWLYVYVGFNFSNDEILLKKTSSAIILRSTLATTIRGVWVPILNKGLKIKEL